MNISKFLRKNFAVILVVLIVAFVIIYMNYQSMIVEKYITAAEAQRNNNMFTLYLIGGVAVVCLIFWAYVSYNDWNNNRTYQASLSRQNI